MKNLFLLLAVVTTMMSCQKENITPNQPVSPIGNNDTTDWIVEPIPVDTTTTPTPVDTTQTVVTQTISVKASCQSGAIFQSMFYYINGQLHMPNGSQGMTFALFNNVVKEGDVLEVYASFAPGSQNVFNCSIQMSIDGGSWVTYDSNSNSGASQSCSLHFQKQF
jgi:hypothetical protein